LDEEDMDVDEEPTVRVNTKRKREADDDEEYQGDEGEEEDEEEEEQEVKEVKPKVKKEHGDGRRREQVPTGRHHSPPCEHCARAGMACEEQRGAWACVRCAGMKVACSRGQQGKRRNAGSPRPPKSAKRGNTRREVVYTSSEDERKPDEEPKEKPGLRTPALRPPAPTLPAPKLSAPVKPHTKKGKSKGIFIDY